MRRPLRRLLRDQRGVSAVEFAMLLPLMITLYLGGVEVSQAIAIDRKVTLVVALARRPCGAVDDVTNDDMTNILDAATAVDGAVTATRKLKITVSSVKIDSAERRQSRAGATPRTAPRAERHDVTLPTALNVANTSLIWAEAQYDLQPIDRLRHHRHA